MVSALPEIFIFSFCWYVDFVIYLNPSLSKYNWNIFLELIHSNIKNFSYSIFFSGKDVVAEDSPVGRLGLTVCYDLRFPELYQQLRFQHDSQVCHITWT